MGNEIYNSFLSSLSSKLGSEKLSAKDMNTAMSGYQTESNKKKKGKKTNNDEATGASSAGGFSAPLFSTIKKETKESEKLVGGLADGKKVKDIAKKHRVDISKIQKQISKGIKVEKEHTDDPNKAKEIAMDHVMENPKYYDELKKSGIDEKWSEKYKRSIDCNNPKGFSQKAHCQGKKKKIETKEATGGGSSGSYETPAAWAKTTSKKDWRGASKTQIPGGKFVKVKKKCTKFPYCNQGDIKALKLFDNKLVESVIKKISEKHKISEKLIKEILENHMIQKFGRKQ